MSHARNVSRDDYVANIQIMSRDMIKLRHDKAPVK